MSAHSVSPLPMLRHLPASLPLEGAVRLELQDGVPILRASTAVQRRIATLLRKQQKVTLSPDETTELDRYEELDDYLSFLNRVVRNVLHNSQA
jgi:phosphoglycerate-specific signal transduction histidine kinase